MGIAYIATAITMIFTGLLPSSCSKVSTLSKAAAKPDTNSVLVASNTKDLGELSLTNHYETRIEIGAGKSCTIRPNLVGRKDLQLTMSLESKKTDGKTEGLIVTRVVARQGKSFEVAIGDMIFTLTPNIVPE